MWAVGLPKLSWVGVGDPSQGPEGALGQLCWVCLLQEWVTAGGEWKSRTAFLWKQLILKESNFHFLPISSSLMCPIIRDTALPYSQIPGHHIYWFTSVKAKTWISNSSSQKQHHKVYILKQVNLSNKTLKIYRVKSPCFQQIPLWIVPYISSVKDTLYNYHTLLCKYKAYILWSRNTFKHSPNNICSFRVCKYIFLSGKHLSCQDKMQRVWHIALHWVKTLWMRGTQATWEHSVCFRFPSKCQC